MCEAGRANTGTPELEAEVSVSLEERAVRGWEAPEAMGQGIRAILLPLCRRRLNSGGEGFQAPRGILYFHASPGLPPRKEKAICGHRKIFRQFKKYKKQGYILVSILETYIKSTDRNKVIDVYTVKYIEKQKSMSRATNLLIWLFSRRRMGCEVMKFLYILYYYLKRMLHNF